MVEGPDWLEAPGAGRRETPPGSAAGSTAPLPYLVLSWPEAEAGRMEGGGDL